MRITINRMRGSLAHKVGSGQAVFRQMKFWRGTPLQNCSRHQKQVPFAPRWHFGEEHLEEMPKISPAEATGGILVRSRDAKWKSG